MGRPPLPQAFYGRIKPELAPHDDGEELTRSLGHSTPLLREKVTLSGHEYDFVILGRPRDELQQRAGILVPNTRRYVPLYQLEPEAARQVTEQVLLKLAVERRAVDRGLDGLSRAVRGLEREFRL